MKSKKFILSASLILASVIYALYQNTASMSVTLPIASTETSHTNNEVATASPAPSQKTQTPSKTPTQSAPPPTPAPKPKGQYVDGTYTGSVADAYYGNIQVEATVSGGKLTNVTFLQYPSDRSTSRYINSQAMPLLRQEAISAQSANVDGVSGATDSSQAFIESLSSALAQAKA